MVDRGHGIQHEVSLGHILQICEDEPLTRALIDLVVFSRKDGRLVHLFLRDVWLEAHERKPVGLFDSDRGHVFDLAVVEFSEESVLNVVDVLGLGFVFLAFDVHFLS
eukprot:CAMPEP_0170552292 /NCGR_PEP_ID=MMETSP0211-20121228/10181_1 /TAXON_ID=311385 /ORGANISM="Pseudokeronopsis sp., Strain OXSARD2" /LENGTH=106 /DNA_ID=CAMNT_0010859899 /DNA_START=808 /DNA_END=1128 /DNA_ORIENTATION=-